MLLKYKFIDLEVGKYYRFYFSGRQQYFSGRVGRVESICNDHCLISGPNRGQQVSRTFFVSTPNPNSIHRFGIYYWDHGYGEAKVYKDGESPRNTGYKLVDGIQFVEELDITTDQEYYDLREK